MRPRWLAQTSVFHRQCCSDRKEARRSATESLLDGRVLLLADIGDEVRWRERVHRAIKLQRDETSALGERQDRHVL